MTFDTAAFLADHFPTPTHVIAALDTFGYALPSEHAVRKWFARKQIPAAYMPLLYVIAEQSAQWAGAGKYIQGRG